MIIIPLGHDRLVVERLPFVTFALIAICVLLYIGTHQRMESDAVQLTRQRQAYRLFHGEYPFLELHEGAVLRAKSHDRRVYEGQREWVAWFENSPDEVLDYLANTRQRAPNPISKDLSQLFQKSSPRSTASRGGQEALKELGLGEDAKYAFLLSMAQYTVEERGELQSELNRQWLDIETAAKQDFLSRFGYVPAESSIRGLIGHMFLHAGILHLLFNMLMLWLAAPKLEDRLGRPLFLLLYVVFGIIGALAHHFTYPNSFTPLVGASGAIAGLMGAFLIRCGTANIRFFYMYWLIHFIPRTGTFKAPAFLMLPLWFIGEVGNAWLLGGHSMVAYYAHIGGFVAGVVVALVFRLTDFEYRVLGRELDDEDDLDENPLVMIPRSESPVIESVDIESAKSPMTSLPTSVSQFTAEPADSFGLHLDIPAEYKTQSSGDILSIPPPTSNGVVLAATLPELPLSHVFEPVLPVVSPSTVSRSVSGYRPSRSTRKMHPAAVTPPPLPVIVPREALLTGVTHDTLGLRLDSSVSARFPGTELFGLTAAVIEQISAQQMQRSFSMGLPQEPATLLVLIRRTGAQRKNGQTVYVINATRCHFAAFLPPGKVTESMEQNLIRLVRILLHTFPEAIFVPGQSRVTAQRIPVYADFDTFLRHLQHETTPGLHSG